MIYYLTRCHQSWHSVILLIATADITINCTSIVSRGSLWSLKHKYNINSWYYHQYANVLEYYLLGEYGTCTGRHMACTLYIRCPPQKSDLCKVPSNNKNLTEDKRDALHYLITKCEFVLNVTLGTWKTKSR